MHPPNDLPPDWKFTPGDGDFWSGWGGPALGVVAMIGGGLLLRLFPESSMRRPTLAVFSIGLGFDLLSAFGYIMTLITGRNHSGIPIVGMIIYTFAWLIVPRPVILPSFEGHTSLWLHKFIDLFALALFHLICHAPLWLFGRSLSPRDQSGADR